MAKMGQATSHQPHWVCQVQDIPCAELMSSAYSTAPQTQEGRAGHAALCWAVLWGGSPLLASLLALGAVAVLGPVGKVAVLLREWPLCRAPAMAVMAVAVLVMTLQSGFPVWLHFCSDWGHVKPNKVKHFLQAEAVGSSQEMALLG